MKTPIPVLPDDSTLEAAVYSVYAVENPLMDYIMHEGYGFLERFGAKPGTMQLVEHAVFQAILEASSSFSVVPGGSGANTVRALSMLIGPDVAMGQPCYSGGIGRDKAGAEFIAIMNGLGIATEMASKDDATGVSAIVVTPDHERTMFTHLGACRNFAPDDLSLEFLDNSRYLYSTGYMWDTEPQKEALFAAVKRARAKGVHVCFDLADPFVVDRYHKDLSAWVAGRVDVLFANRQELARVTECDGTDYEIMREAARLAPIVVMKIGKGGCLVLHRGRLSHAAGETVSCVDTTGAGDSFAAGFLYGLIAGKSISDCAKLGNRIAARIVSVEGCRYDCVERDDVLAAISHSP